MIDRAGRREDNQLPHEFNAYSEIEPLTAANIAVENAAEARKFWREVSQGGVEFEESHPTTVLDSFFKAVAEDKMKLDSATREFLPGKRYAWNAFREGKTITT